MSMKAEDNKVGDEQQVMTPWDVVAKPGAKIDYDELIDQFKCQRLEQNLIDQVQRLTSQPPHVFLRCGVFFVHYDFDEILGAYEKGDKFYLYTGRGPSSVALHLGHLMPFKFTRGQKSITDKEVFFFIIPCKNSTNLNFVID